MFYPGLVSISFRNHSPVDIASEAARCRLLSIEWGSDVHAPVRILLVWQSLLICKLQQV